MISFVSFLGVICSDCKRIFGGIGVFLLFLFVYIIVCSYFVVCNRYVMCVYLVELSGVCCQCMGLIIIIGKFQECSSVVFILVCVKFSIVCFVLVNFCGNVCGVNINVGLIVESVLLIVIMFVLCNNLIVYVVFVFLFVCLVSIFVVSVYVMDQCQYLLVLRL